ncbi:MAG: hypothetical protein JWL71_2901 [Acidobacteria bacterium]|nr:hypothetical protein [Acidobacteriota bacterium]
MMSATLPAAAPGVIARNVGGEIVLVPTQAEVVHFHSVFLLSRVGAFLWEQLDGNHDREGLIQLVRERYAVPEDHDVGRDVDTFLSELHRRGLLAA